MECSNPCEYLFLEEEINQAIFDHPHYNEKRNVKLIVSTFKDYALTWWNVMLCKRSKRQGTP